MRKKKITSLDTVAERVTHLRDLLHLDRPEFSKRMNHLPSGDEFYRVEMGRSKLSEKAVEDICATYHVNPDWLRLGEGAVFEEGCDPESIAGRIREYREFILYTEKDMAERLGLSVATVQNIEANRCEPRVAEISRVLGANEEWLITGKGSMVRSGVLIPDYSRQIKIMMEYLGLNWAQLGRETDLGAWNISDIVKKRRRPATATVRKICDTYGIRKEWLRDGTGSMFQEGKERPKKTPIKGSRLRILWQAMHMSRSTFAKKIGKLPGEMMYYENGQYNITDEMIKTVCEVFPVSEAWLRYGEGEMFTKPLDVVKPRIDRSKLYEFRLSLGLSLNEFAKRANISPTHLSNIENGVVQAGASVEKKLIETYGEEINNLREVPWTVRGRLYLLRENEKLSLRRLGKKLGVSRQVILNIEDGSQKKLDDYIQKYCETFGVEERWIRTGEGPTYKPSREGKTYSDQRDRKQERKARNEQENKKKAERADRELRYTEMAARLRKIRNDLGVSQAEFAEAIGTKGPVICNMELLKYKGGISAYHVDKISKVYGINPEWFEYGTGDMMLPGRTMEKKKSKRRGVGKPRKYPSDEGIKALRREIEDLEKKLEAKRTELKLMEESAKIERR